MKKILIVGAGAIGSLYAAHLARVAEVWAFARRPEHVRSINHHGIRVTGHNEFHARLRASSDVQDLPHFDFGIVATRQTRRARPLLPSHICSTVVRCFRRKTASAARRSLPN